MIRFLENVFEALAAMQQKRAQARMLSQLDERTLRDIGMEIEAINARQRRRIELRFGTY